MWNFATEALGKVSFVALVPTVIWMLFVLNLDRWLVTPQPNARRRVGPLFTRLLIALMLGVVTAEPLVLRIFQTAIEERVSDQRTDTIAQLRTNLVRCNPVPSKAQTVTPEGCGRTYVLSFGAARRLANGPRNWLPCARTLLLCRSGWTGTAPGWRPSTPRYGTSAAD